MLTIFRNISAHNERVFDVKTIFKLRKTNTHKYFSKDNINYGEDDIFALCIVFKKMLSEKDFNDFFNDFKIELEKLEENINSESFAKIKNEMGLPKNWQDIEKL